jgi:hypothetical protein
MWVDDMQQMVEDCTDMYARSTGHVIFEIFDKSLSSLRAQPLFRCLLEESSQ